MSVVTGTRRSGGRAELEFGRILVRRPSLPSLGPRAASMQEDGSNSTIERSRAASLSYGSSK